MEGFEKFVKSIVAKLEEFKASISETKESLFSLKNENKAIKDAISELKSEIKGVNEQKTLFSTALAAFDGHSEKMKSFFKTAQIDLNNVIMKANDRIDKAIEAIPRPKDGSPGKDAVVDYAAIDKTIDAKFSDTEQKISKEIKDEIADRVSQIKIPKPKEPEQVNYDVVDLKIRAALDPVKQKQSEKTVKDIIYDAKKRALTVEYTDGKTKSIPLPTGGGGSVVYQSGGGGTETYTNLTPTAVSIGGIPAGSTFDNMTMQEMWDALLYPYQTPIFSSFTSSMSTPIEVGSTIPAGSVTFLWNTTNSSNIAANSIKIDDITAGNNLASGLANTGTTAISISAITNVMATSHQWKITATNTKGAFVSRTLNVYWQWKIYYGESALTDLIEADVEALRVGTLAANVSGNYSFNAGEYKWICYPTSFGLKTTFKDASTNFDVAMQPALTKSITNSQGVSTNYYCYRTVNKLGGSITIAIS